jgi:uncharacterized protein
MDLSVMLRVAGREMYPAVGLRDSLRRQRFWHQSRQHLPFVERLLQSDRSGRLAKALTTRPHVLGMLAWPYINRHWSVEERFQRFADHYSCLERHPALDLDVGSRVRLADLAHVHPGLELVLDRPQWFLREGELALNLFVDGERIYSLAFSLGQQDGIDLAFVGCIQGRDIDGIDRLYRELTRHLHGARPRDFLIGALQLICEVEGVGRIRAVSESGRHHRHAFFGSKVDRTPSADYDTIWSDRGGVALERGFHELPARLTFRSTAEIPSSKRAQYRQRYALYGQVREALVCRLAPVAAPAKAAESVS